jgi:hypothetical protein
MPLLAVKLEGNILPKPMREYGEFTWAERWHVTHRKNIPARKNF